MYIVYVLKAFNKKLRYVGFTRKEIKTRLYEHNTGKNNSQIDVAGNFSTMKKVIVGNVQGNVKSF